jgi:hypothetical protein
MVSALAASQQNMSGTNMKRKKFVLGSVAVLLVASRQRRRDPRRYRAHGVSRCTHGERQHGVHQRSLHAVLSDDIRIEGRGIRSGLFVCGA